MSRLLDELFLSNPMKIEIARFRRRLLGFGSKGITSIVLLLLLLAYAGIVAVVVNTSGDFPPIVLLMLQTALYCFFGPALLHGSIAGERERRSWDLLLVAPISKAQIVAGKFLGALAAVGVGAIALGIPMAIAGAGYRETSASSLLLAEAISLSFCAFVCALTIFFSARSKRPLIALGNSLGSLTIALVAIPALVASLSSGDQRWTTLSLYFNPFWATGMVLDSHSFALSENLVPRYAYGLPQLLTYLGLTVGLLLYTVRTLNVADNEAHFMTRLANDA